MQELNMYPFTNPPAARISFLPAIRVVLVAWVAFFAASCTETPGKTDIQAKLNVVCTTGMIGDALAHVAGEKAVITTLMGPGVDPHLYKATQGDLQTLTDADIIFYNGLHLEGKMGEIFRKLSRTKRVIALAEQLPQKRLLRLEGNQDAIDPHIWFDVSLWAEAVNHAGMELARTDSSNADYYLRNTRAYLAELDSLHRWTAAQISAIPRENRVLITAHDAFGYFGKAYDIEVRGLQGISTASEYGLRDISNLVSFLTERKIKAVFVESSVPAKSLEAVVEGCSRRGHEVAIGGSLFSDAMGRADSPEGTYTGMVKANVKAIAKALK